MNEANFDYPDINQDLEAQRSLSDYLVGRIVESSRISHPYGAGDEESFGYATAIYAETQAKIAKLEGVGDKELKATGADLRNHINELMAAGENGEPGLSGFSANMGLLLAERLDGSPNGVVPTGYAVASQLLRHDCATERNGFTGEPMPSYATGYPPVMYNMFFNMEAISLARGAFGDEFADAVSSVYKELYDKAELRTRLRPMKQSTEPTLEQRNQVFTMLNEGHVADLSAVGKQEAFEVLKKVPGVDPVLAVIDGHDKDIPTSGWVVNSHIAPGYGGVIRIYRYGEKALSYSGLNDTREEYGSARVYFNIDGSGEGYGSHTVAYENPAFPNKDTEPYNRMSETSYTGFSFDSTDIIRLENGGRILDQKSPLQLGRGGISFNMDWQDINGLIDRDGRDVQISRATDDYKAMISIVAHLSYAMGMDGQGIKALTQAVEDKTKQIEAETTQQQD